MITKASRNELLQNIKDSYKTAMLTVAIVTNTTDHTNLNKRAHRSNGNMQKHPAMHNLMTSMTHHTSRTQPGPTVTTATNTTSCSTVSGYFMQRLNMETETPKHKTLNNALVPKNEVLSITWKLSVNHAPSHT